MLFKEKGSEIDRILECEQETKRYEGLKMVRK